MNFCRLTLVSVGLSSILYFSCPMHLMTIVHIMPTIFTAGLSFIQYIFDLRVRLPKLFRVRRLLSHATIGAAHLSLHLPHLGASNARSCSRIWVVVLPFKSSFEISVGSPPGFTHTHTHNSFVPKLERDLNSGQLRPRDFSPPKITRLYTFFLAVPSAGVPCNFPTNWCLDP